MAGNFWQSSHCEQWLLEKADILRGRAEDLKIYSEEEYHKLFSFFCTVIQTIGQDQQVGRTRMQVIATACVYFRRFYVRRSLKDIDPFLLAPTCLFLASKVEEHGMLSTNKLMSAMAQAVKKLPYQPPDLSYRIGYIHEAEFLLLEILDCCLIVYQPYRPLKQFMQDLREANTPGLNELEQFATRVCNDSLKTDACLLYAPHIIAMACIQFAAISLNREKEFISFFADMSIEFEKVFDVVQQLTFLYKITIPPEDREQLKALLGRLPKVNPTPPPPAAMVVPSGGPGLRRSKGSRPQSEEEGLTTPQFINQLHLPPSLPAS